VLKNLDNLPLDGLLPGDEVHFAGQLKKRIRENALRFLDMARELPHVRL
jgi:hypothetical protein